ncbi:MAG: threonine/serine exporter family protein, partial [Lachnospiraceae bacterium]|nr:threonine/serine exporter family protein [Lachnospiraceae bacterium]
MMMQILAAVAGTVAFSLLFGVPRRYYPLCGLIGGIGWAVYVLVEASFSPSVAAWIATMAVIFLSRLGAI